MRNIDIHCHILPGLDDGASSEKESLRMLKLAAKNGIKGVIATPHYSVGYPNLCPERIRESCAELEEKAREEVAKDFFIYPGQEILYNQDVPDLLQAGELLTMADTDYVLIEFMPWTPYSEMKSCVNTLTLMQYDPIIAHVERYDALREKGRPEELIDMGARLQMNYRRIGGKWYEDTTRWCRKMLKQGKIDFLGTDMHNMKSRKPDILDAMIWMEKHLDMTYMKEICYENARQIIKSKDN